MKLVSYNKDEQDQLAILVDSLLYDTDLMHPDLPVSMGMFLNYWEEVYAMTIELHKKLAEGKISRQQAVEYDTVEILEPVPHSTSFRNAITFPRHMASATPDPEPLILQNYSKYPFFYFANHNCFQGPGEVVCMPDHLKKLDFEPGVAIVICKAGKNIKAADANNYIGGYMIMNNISARHYLTTEATIDILSANGKGFSTPIGPMLVTPDELEPYKVENNPNHTGHTYNLSIKCLVNDMQVSEGNLANMPWTFAEIIEQASYGVQLFPGDIIGSGPAGGGSFVEINATGILNNPDYKEQWLKEGDVVKIEIEGLGTLSNTIVKEESDVFITEAPENISVNL